MIDGTTSGSLEPLSALLRSLSGENGFVTQALTWIAALRLAIKPGQIWIRDRIISVLQRAAESADISDDQIVESVLTSSAWRVTAFILDFLASLKLPLVDDFRRIRSQSQTPTKP